MKEKGEYPRVKEVHHSDGTVEQRTQITSWHGGLGPGRLTRREEDSQLNGTQQEPLVNMENFGTMRVALKMALKFGSKAVTLWPPSEELIKELFEEDTSFAE